MTTLKSLKEFIAESTLTQGDAHDKDWDDMSDAAKELSLHAENDSKLYHQSWEPIRASMQRKVKNGSYDRSKLPQAMKHHADRAAMSYAKEHGDGTPYHQMFSPSDRKQAAHYMAAVMHDEVHHG